jgi:hypothetical protein
MPLLSRREYACMILPLSAQHFSWFYIVQTQNGSGALAKSPPRPPHPSPPTRLLGYTLNMPTRSQALDIGHAQDCDMARSDTNTSWYMPEVAGTVTLGVTYSDGRSFHPTPCTLHPTPYTLLSSQPAR